MDKYNALVRDDTWILVPPVLNANLIDCKWVYKLKKDKTGTITRYKARFVAKFHQQVGIDYQETFRQVVKSTTIRVVLSVIITQQRPLRKLDVQNVVLDGTLAEIVYMKQ